MQKSNRDGKDVRYRTLSLDFAVSQFGNINEDP